MGCCMGKEASGAEQRGVNNLSKNKDNRANTWRATGIVSLRDGNIKVTPRAATGLRIPLAGPQRHEHEKQRVRAAL